MVAYAFLICGMWKVICGNEIAEGSRVRVRLGSGLLARLVNQYFLQFKFCKLLIAFHNSAKYQYPHCYFFHCCLVMANAMLV